LSVISANLTVACARFFFSLLPEFEEAIEQSRLGFLHVRLASLDLGHHNCSILQGPDGFVIVHAFSLVKTAVAVC
jgi:hypothetical protein